MGLASKTNQGRHPLQPDELDMLRNNILNMIGEMKAFGVDPNNVTPDAAWMIYCCKTQLKMHRAGMGHKIAATMEVFADPVHSFREEFDGLWQDFLANQK